MKTKFCLMISAALLALTAFSYGQVKDDMKDAAHDTGNATKTAAKKTGHATEKAAAVYSARQFDSDRNYMRVAAICKIVCLDGWYWQYQYLLLKSYRDGR